MIPIRYQVWINEPEAHREVLNQPFDSDQVKTRKSNSMAKGPFKQLLRKLRRPDSLAQERRNTGVKYRRKG